MGSLTHSTGGCEARSPHGWAGVLCQFNIPAAGLAHKGAFSNCSTPTVLSLGHVPVRPHGKHGADERSLPRKEKQTNSQQISPFMTVVGSDWGRKKVEVDKR